MTGRRAYAYLTLWLILLSGCAPLTVQVQNVSSTATQPAPADSSAATPRPEVPGAQATEAILSTLVTYLTFFAELSGALVIAAAVVRGLLRYVPHLLHRQTASETYTEDIRLQLGKSLALALEFELGADILKTAVAPSPAIIAQLAAIAALRTFLNYFLERELRQAEQRRAGTHLQREREHESGSEASPVARSTDPLKRP